MKSNPKATAYDLYFKTNLTQTQIAERAGVSTRTLYDWMKQGNWKTLKANSRIMPAQIVDDIYNHISHLNWRIKTRDFEDRYPSKEEAETLRKLIFSIPKIKMNVSKGESAQAMINFVSWLQTRNNDAAIFISDYIDEYLHAGREKGLEPYEFEYDADQYYNPQDYPWRKEHTFEQRVSDDRKSSPPCPSDRRAYFQGGVPAEPNDALAGGGGSPLAPDTPPASLRGVSQAPEQSATACPDDISGKQPRQNTDQEAQPEAPDDQQKPEPDQNQTRSKPEASPASTTPTKRPDNQAPDLKKLPNPTSENKKYSKPEEASEADIRERIQKVFESWQKEIKKNKRRH